MSRNVVSIVMFTFCVSMYQPGYFGTQKEVLVELKPFSNLQITTRQL